MRGKAYLLIGIGVLLVTGIATARSQPQDQNVLSALLVEVRGLRAAMEQMASAGPRVQLALGRLQLQEQRLNNLITRLETTRDSLATAQRQLAERQVQAAGIDVELKTGATQEQRQQAEQMLGIVKQELTSASAEVQRLSAEESSIVTEIANEQGRWNDFNQRLEELERSLGRQ